MRRSKAPRKRKTKSSRVERWEPAMFDPRAKLSCGECGSTRVKLWKSELICLDCGTVVEELFDFSEE